MNNFIIVIPALVIQFLSCFFFLKGKINISILLLLISGIFLRFYFITFDPFLHDWDEKFHALVAKNTSMHFLMPTLIENPVLPYDKSGWWGTHVWLHKQPLFIWQMALAIKLFGANTFAVRLPSLLMASILILVIFDIGKKSASLSIGFISAFIFTCYEPIFQLVSGVAGMDHNDTAFLFYVTLSVWAWVRFESCKKKRWAILMGIFAGCSILTKWLTGSMIFISFGFYHLILERDLFSQASISALLWAIISCVLIALPWQIFILMNYPTEAIMEYKFNSLHFTEVVEGHVESIWYYFLNVPIQYKCVWWCIVIGLIYAICRFRKYTILLSLFFMVLCVYAFFTLAKTKLPFYTIVVSPILIIFIAISIDIIMKWFDKLQRWGFYLNGLVFLLIIIVFYDFQRVEEFYYDRTNIVGQTRTQKNKELAEYKIIKGRLPQKSVIVGFPEMNYIEARFFTGYDCFGWLPDSSFNQLKRSGKSVFIHPEELNYIKANN